MSMAADDHTRDIGPAGVSGHNGTKGSTMTSRLDKHGKWGGTCGENISFGC